MLEMALRDWIWFEKNMYASEEKVPSDISNWKCLISQLKTLNTKAALQVHSLFLYSQLPQLTVRKLITPPSLTTYTVFSVNLDNMQRLS